MKKLVILAISIFITMNLFSQIEKGKLIISVDGNYSESSTESGVMHNKNINQGKYLKLGTSIGCFITDRFIAGIGLDYNWGKEDRLNKLMINKFYQQELANVELKALLPNLYLGYYHPITEKLYVNINIKFNYGKIKSEYDDYKAGTTDDLSDNTIKLSDKYSSSYTMKFNNSSKIDFFGISILPELSYFISSKFSLYIGLGGASYSFLDWETDNSNWLINFNPTYWNTGVKINI